MPTFKEQGFDIVASLWRSIMVRAGTPRAIVDTLVAALEKIEQTRQWRDFSQLNMQSSVSITLDGMQAQVRDEIVAYRAFLESIGAGR